MTTCIELLKVARHGNPKAKYTHNREHTAIGAWNETLGRYQCCAFQDADGTWRPMTMELIIDGKLAREEDWIGND